MFLSVCPPSRGTGHCASSARRVLRKSEMSNNSQTVNIQPVCRILKSRNEESSSTCSIHPVRSSSSPAGYVSADRRNPAPGNPECQNTSQNCDCFSFLDATRGVCSVSKQDGPFREMGAKVIRDIISRKTLRASDEPNAFRAQTQYAQALTPRPLARAVLPRNILYKLIYCM